MHGVGRPSECTATVDAHLLAGADHAQRDLAAVGDQDFVEHGRPYSMIIRGLAVFDRLWPSSTRMRLTVPARGAGMWFIVFIASTALFDLDLSEIGFTQDGGEFPDQSGVEPAILLGRLVGHERQSFFLAARATAASMARR
jgi:hypothetical protein